jgi:hypothetical protein
MASAEPTPLEVLIERLSHVVKDRKPVKCEPMPSAPAAVENPQFPTVYVPPAKPVDTPTKLGITPNILPEASPNLHLLSGAH